MFVNIDTKNLQLIKFPGVYLLYWCLISQVKNFHIPGKTSWFIYNYLLKYNYFTPDTDDIRK